MNFVHRLVCSSPFWRAHLYGVLPWALKDVPLYDTRVLELGPGPGHATDWLRTRAGQLTVIEIDGRDAQALSGRLPDVDVHHGDATNLPFDDDSFDVIVCHTMLHHVSTAAAQNQLFMEAARVLVAGGVFAGSDSRWGPAFALAHIGDTMTLVDPDTLPARLRTAGFPNAQVQARRRDFRFVATTPAMS